MSPLGLQQPQQQHDDFSDQLFLYAVLGAGGITASVYAGAWLASKLRSPRAFTPSFGEAFAAAIHLPENRGEPQLAWPEQYQAALPGPIAYWTMTGLVVLLVVALAGFVMSRKWRKDTLDHRERLGVDTQARSATRKDLQHLLVRDPDPRRLIIGRYKRWWVATEAERQSGRHNRRSSGAQLPISDRRNRARPPT